MNASSASGSSSSAYAGCRVWVKVGVEVQGQSRAVPDVALYQWLRSGLMLGLVVNVRGRVVGPGQAPMRLCCWLKSKAARGRSDDGERLLVRTTMRHGTDVERTWHSRSFLWVTEAVLR